MKGREVKARLVEQDVGGLKDRVAEEAEVEVRFGDGVLGRVVPVDGDLTLQWYEMQVSQLKGNHRNGRRV